jgi:hypothetical protein
LWLWVRRRIWFGSWRRLRFGRRLWRRRRDWLWLGFRSRLGVWIRLRLWHRRRFGSRLRDWNRIRIWRRRRYWLRDRRRCWLRSRLGVWNRLWRWLRLWRRLCFKSVHDSWDIRHLRIGKLHNSCQVKLVKLFRDLLIIVVRVFDLLLQLLVAFKKLPQLYDRSDAEALFKDFDQVQRQLVERHHDFLGFGNTYIRSHTVSLA